MADTSGPGSYTTPPNANFKGQIQTPNRSHSCLSGAVRIPQDTRSPWGKQLKTPTSEKIASPRICSPSARTALTGVTESSTRRPLRPRRLRPAPDRGTCKAATPVTATGTSPLSPPPSAATPYPPRPFSDDRPPAGSARNSGVHPGLSSGGAAAAVLLPTPQPGPEDTARVPRRGSCMSPDSESPTKPARAPTP